MSKRSEREASEHHKQTLDREALAVLIHEIFLEGPDDERYLECADHLLSKGYGQIATLAAENSEHKEAYARLLAEAELCASANEDSRAEAAALHAENARLTKEHGQVTRANGDLAIQLVGMQARTRALEAALRGICKHQHGGFHNLMESVDECRRYPCSELAALTEPTPPAGEQG